MSEAREQLLQQTYAARDAYLQQWGELDPLVQAPLINLAFQGGPRWPDLRQAFRIVRDGANTLVVGDGLADPFDDDETPNVGFGVGILCETPDPIEGSVVNDWPFWIAYDVAQAAAHGGFRELIDELDVLSMEIECRYGPSELATPEGRLGLLLGVRSPARVTDWEFPAGSVKVITVKVLHPSELEVCVNEDGGRERLRDLFVADGTYHLSSAKREPVV